MSYCGPNDNPVDWRSWAIALSAILEGECPDGAATRILAAFQKDLDEDRRVRLAAAAGGRNMRAIDGGPI